MTTRAASDRVVPPSGASAWLTSFTAGAMTFLAVFALALSLASGRLADRWAGALNRTATIRISAPDDQMAQQTKAVLDLHQGAQNADQILSRNRLEDIVVRRMAWGFSTFLVDA